MTAEEEHAGCTGKHLDLAPSLAKKGGGLESALAGTYDGGDSPARKTERSEWSEEWLASSDGN